MKKLAVIGRGTVGCVSALQLKLNFPDAEVQWHYDPSINPQSVGEGTTLILPKLLSDTINFSSKDYSKVDGYVKTGIFKDGWSSDGKSFLHDFPPPAVALHFNAVKMQDYIYGRLKDHVNIFEQNITPEDIDADYIIDCSGKPNNFKNHTMSGFIPVNSVHVTQCFWEAPKFSHTLTIARPYGWVFGIPLQNRCSIGYMYNSDINTLDEVKEDVKAIFRDYSLTPSNTTSSFAFKNYYKNKNFNERSCSNGNASFFLEPLEAMSFGMASSVLNGAMDYISGLRSLDNINSEYGRLISNVESIIMMHYFAGSKYKTDFWDFAKERGEACMNYAKYSEHFCDMVKTAKPARDFGTFPEDILYSGKASIDFMELNNLWWAGSFSQNLDGLGIRKKIESVLGINQTQDIAAE